MSNVWFISDTHFNQKNILVFTDHNDVRIRPEFNSVEEMNEVMIERWNAKVNPGDKVWHLGDVHFGDYNFYKKEIHARLKGSKRLLVGNHDDIGLMLPLFKKVQLINNSFKKDGFIMSHMPIHKFSLYDHRTEKPMVNVHGHIHEKDVPDVGYVNISCEKTDYAPIHLEDLKKLVDAETEKLWASL